MFITKRFNNKNKKSHIFCAEYNNGAAHLICTFRSKPAGVRVMKLLHERLFFEELVNGNVLEKRVFYFDTDEGKYRQDFPVFQFEKVRNAKQLEKEINETIGELFNEQSRVYVDLHTAFDDEVRNAILGRMEPADQPAEEPAPGDGL